MFRRIKYSSVQRAGTVVKLTSVVLLFTRQSIENVKGYAKEPITDSNE